MSLPPNTEKPANLAERYRADRAAFELAQQWGCTPKEAVAELKRRAAQTELQPACDRIKALRNAPIQRADPEPPPQPWLLRD